MASKGLALKGFDLFSGVGGFRKATLSPLVQAIADIRFVGYCEIDPYAVRTYMANYNTHNEHCFPNVEEITKLSENDILKNKLDGNPDRRKKIDDMLPDFDILFAGFPCQSHSLMGNRKGFDDTRGCLFYSIREILAVKQPEYFILENVRAIKSVNDGTFFTYIQHCLRDELGYSVCIMDLNSADFGVPQTRRRTYFLGIRGGGIQPEDFIVPEKMNRREYKYPTVWHLLEKEVDSKYFLSERIKMTILADEKKGYRRKAEINKLIARPLTTTMHKMHRASQDNYYSMDFINGTYDETSNQVIKASSGAENIRRITPLEAFRIQGFDDDFVKNAVEAGLSDTRLYMQAGNAVSVPVVERLIPALLETGRMREEFNNAVSIVNF